MAATTTEKQKALPDFVIIDDDSISNVICQMIIHNEWPDARIDIFTDPQKGLEYIVGLNDDPAPNSVILLLDITMPDINGGDVLEEIKKCCAAIVQRLTVYMLSSSVIPHDQQTAADDTFVAGYVIKPLSHVKLQEIFAKT